MTAPFEVDFSTLPIAHRYKLLAALVVPRPITLVTTVGEDGIVNAAPFVFQCIQRGPGPRRPGHPIEAGRHAEGYAQAHS